MGVAIGKMVAEDPTFKNRRRLQSILNESHLDKVDILKRTYGVEALIASHKWPTARVLLRRSRTATHIKQSVFGQFAKIQYTLEPLEPGEGFQFESTVVGGNVPREFWPAVEKG